jgi:hypothetical protein
VARSGSMPDSAIQGSVLALVLYDVCEEIRLDEVRRILGAPELPHRFKDVQGENVRVERPPVMQTLEPLVMRGGERLTGQIKFYDYGVVSLVYQLPFRGSWEELVQMGSRWMAGSEFEHHTSDIVRQQMAAIAPAMVKPNQTWLSEDYFIFHLLEIPGISNATDLLAAHGDSIVQLVRGETTRLSDGERAEILQSSISYYPHDLAVVGWNAAVVFDTLSGAETAIQLLEYANSQLLEFRHYDDLLTHVLAGVYSSLERKGGLWDRWKLANQASKLKEIVIDVTELTERADNAIKFLSDMFAARLYRLVAARVGVPDYKILVNQKLHTAEELYGFMVEQFHQTRTFILELMVVVILVIEMVFLFKGK